MSHPAPWVFIGGQRIYGSANAERPVLDGLTITFGNDSDLEMQAPESCTLQILATRPMDLSFIELGRTVAVYHSPTGTESEFTYFVGRVQAAEAVPDDRLPGALLITVEAVDLMTDLANDTVYDVNAADALASARISHMAYWLDDSWQLATFPPRWPDRLHAALHYESKNFLELFDQFLRGQLMIRRNASTYTPAGGVVKTLTAMQDSSQDTDPDKLGTYANGTWGIIAGAPGGAGSVKMTLPGSNVLADAGWSKDPEDLLTEVELNVIRPGVYDTEKAAWEDSENFPKVSRNYIDTQPLRQTYGVRSVTLDTDLPNTADTVTMAPIFNHWVGSRAAWRTKTVNIKDSDLLSIQQISWLLSPVYRYSIHLVIRNLLENRPDILNPDIRGFVIGGAATFTGGKWDISLVLGRPPKIPAAGDYWNATRLAAIPAFADTTAATVGDELSALDFLRIGAP